MGRRLSPEEIAERAQSHIERVESPEWTYIKPLSDAADSWLDFTTNPEGRYRLGLDEIDIMTRGFGRGELVFITGKPFSGKTQVVLNAIANNPEARTLIYTLDEPRELVFAKLAALTTGINSDELERRVRAGDAFAVDAVRKVAIERIPSLFIVDDSLTLGQMTDAKNEATIAWGAPPDLVVIDYLELLPGEGVDQKAQGLKRWCKNADVPVICLHQASRGSSERGKPGGMDAMRFGGTAEATFVIEVFRKREDEDLDPHERRYHQDTVTINLAKCKRPPGKVGMHDFHMDEETGLITSNAPMVQPRPRTVKGKPQRNWAERALSDQLGVT